MGHDLRPGHDPQYPVHVGMRFVEELPMRRADLAAIVSGAIRDGQRDAFRIVVYALPGNHMHLIVEAQDRETLSNGVRALGIRIANRVNVHLVRRGGVIEDRGWWRDLKTPTETRNTLVYVLQNAAHHGGAFLDPCSSAAWFWGWSEPVPCPPGPSPVVEPRTWLLSSGWLRAGGPIHPCETPAVDRHPHVWIR